MHLTDITKLLVCFVRGTPRGKIVCLYMRKFVIINNYN